MASEKQFVHLHVHSDFSPLDGLSSVEGIVNIAADFGNPAVAVTDHGTLGGAVQLIKHAKKRGIQPIVGIEVYHVPDVEVKGKVAEGKSNYHMILLAKNMAGYKNLVKLSSLASTKHRYGKYSRVDNALLAQYSEGVIATTGCIGSLVNQTLLHQGREDGLAVAKELRDIYGVDNYFVEVQDHGIPDQHEILDDQVWLAEKLGVGLLATNDSHYDRAEDAYAHDALLAHQTGSRVNEDDRFKFHGSGHYIKSPEEMWELFPEDRFPGACANTLKVAEMVDFDIKLKDPDNFLIPRMEVPAEFEDADEWLRDMSYKGARKFFGNDDGKLTQEVTDLMEYELDIIKYARIPDYMLLLANVIKWAKSVGIRIGPGRGSAAGSLVAYCIEITSIDPMTHGLSFDRFLNKGRARTSMPDIDIDIEPDRRAEVMAYVGELMGRDNVSKIAAYGLMKPASAIKNAARVLGYPVQSAAEIVKLYPQAVSQVDIPLWAVMEQDRKEIADKMVRQWKAGQDLRTMYRHDKDSRQIIDLALEFEGTQATMTQHAGGLLVTPGPVMDYIPITTMPTSPIAVSYYDKDDVEAVGGLKIDFLGLINLSLIQRAVHLIQMDLGQRIDIDRIPLDDIKVYEMLQRGEVDGIFQIGSGLAQDVTMKVRPSEFKDISAIIALGRPGPMGSNVHLEYADRKNGRSAIEVPHPDMSEILKETYGLVVYQEQVMALAQHYAGYTAIQADDFRRIMGKKLPEDMEAEHPKFIQAVADQGYPESLAKTLWDIIEPFSGYAFNKSHSVAYGMVTYQTAWLKINYPAQYAAACIDYLPKNVPAQVEAARNLGVQVYAPDINKSRDRATTSRDAIWLGIGGLPNCGVATLEGILLDRNTAGDYKSIGDFLVRTRAARVTKRAVESLIYVGAFDSLHPSRKQMIIHLPDMIEDAKSQANTESFFDAEASLFDIGDSLDTALDLYDLTGEDFSRQDRIRKELEVLGFFVGKHPFAELHDQIEEALSTGVIPDEAVIPSELNADAGDDVKIYGILTNLEHQVTKARKPYSKYVVETDYSSRISVMMFGVHLPDRMQGTLVLMDGKVKDDIVEDDEGSSSNLVKIVFADTVKEIKLEQSSATSGRGRISRRRGGTGKVIEASHDDSMDEKQEQESIQEPEPAASMEDQTDLAIAPEPEVEPEPEPEAAPEQDDSPRYSRRLKRDAPRQPKEEEFEDEGRAAIFDDMDDAPPVRFKPKAKRVEPRTEPESNIIEFNAERKRRRTSEPVPPTGYIFYAGISEDIKMLHNALSRLGPGAIQITIAFNDQLVTHDKMKFNVTPEDATEISQSIGIRFDEEAPNGTF